MYLFGTQKYPNLSAPTENPSKIRLSQNITQNGNEVLFLELHNISFGTTRSAHLISAS